MCVCVLVCECVSVCVRVCVRVSVRMYEVEIECMKVCVRVNLCMYKGVNELTNECTRACHTCTGLAVSLASRVVVTNTTARRAAVSALMTRYTSKMRRTGPS